MGLKALQEAIIAEGVETLTLLPDEKRKRN